MKCANCGKDIPEKAKVCGYCGTRVEGLKFQTCLECGRESPIKANVCGYCGTRFGKKAAAR